MSCFVLEIPPCNLCPGITALVPCDWVMQRAYISIDKVLKFMKCPVLLPANGHLSSIRKVNKYSLFREKVLKLPYVSRLLPLHQWIKSFLSTNEEAAASKRMEVSTHTFSRNNEYLLS